MDFAPSRYYRLAEVLLKAIGQWPRHNLLHSWGIIIFGLLICISQGIPQTIAAVKHRNDLALLTESVLPLTVVLMILAKIIYLKWNAQKILELLNRIRTDWQMWAREREVEILHVYANLGMKISFFVFVMFMSISIFIITVPAVPKIVDTLFNNGSKPGTLAIAIDYYYFDEQEYYFYVTLHCLFCTSCGFFLAAPFDCMLIISMAHACGIFTALGHKLSDIGNIEQLSVTSRNAYVSGNKDIVFQHLTWCIKRHKDAIEYADLIESTFTWSLFNVMALNVLVVSLSGYEIAKGEVEMNQFPKYLLGFTAGLMHICIETCLPQVLIDRSTNICQNIHCSQWYEQSPKIQKILYFVMMRCNRPCKLTAGRMLIMNVESFTAILKTSMSYITLLRSI